MSADPGIKNYFEEFKARYLAERDYLNQQISFYTTYTRFVEITFYGFLKGSRDIHSSALLASHLQNLSFTDLDLFNPMTTVSGGQNLLINGVEYNTVLTVNAYIRPPVERQRLAHKFQEFLLPMPHLRAYYIHIW